MTEKEMILGCIKEDETSQRALYNLYYEKMFSVCLENSKNERVARESVIEGFVFVFDNIKKFKVFLEPSRLVGKKRTIFRDGCSSCSSWNYHGVGILVNL